MKICIVGGDARNSYLSKELAAAGIIHDLLAHGNELFPLEKIRLYDLIIGPIPFSNDNQHLHAPLYGGSIAVEDFIASIKKGATLLAGTMGDPAAADFTYIDMTKDAELYEQNLIPTIEGILQLILNSIDFTLSGASVLLLGYGRVGRLLARHLLFLGADVRIHTKDAAALAPDGNAAKAAPLDDLSGYDVIINTVPARLLTPVNLRTLKGHGCILDVASFPGGLDIDYARAHCVNFIVAHGIPGKKAPMTVAKNMKKIILRHIALAGQERKGAAEDVR